jgi:hypothetical protein
VALYAIEGEILGRPPDERRQVRQTRARPLLQSLHDWFTVSLTNGSRPQVRWRTIGLGRGSTAATPRFDEWGDRLWREHVPQTAFWIEAIQLSRSDQAIKDGSATSRQPLRQRRNLYDFFITCSWALSYKASFSARVLSIIQIREKPPPQAGLVGKLEEHECRTILLDEPHQVLS